MPISIHRFRFLCSVVRLKTIAIYGMPGVASIFFFTFISIPRILSSDLLPRIFGMFGSFQAYSPWWNASTTHARYVRCRAVFFSFIVLFQSMLFLPFIVFFVIKMCTFPVFSFCLRCVSLRFLFIIYCVVERMSRKLAYHHLLFSDAISWWMRNEYWSVMTALCFIRSNG